MFLSFLFVCLFYLFVVFIPSSWCLLVLFFFFQAEDGIRDRSPSRGLGDVYKRQDQIVHEIDDDAFINILPTHSVFGRFANESEQKMYRSTGVFPEIKNTARKNK